MKALINRILELLKKRVKDNLEVINSNQTMITELLKQPFSPERTYHIDKIYSINKTLLSENNDFINLQLSLNSFNEKYKADLLFKDEDPANSFLYSLMDDNELFDLTVEGKLNFEEGHPKFDDYDFFNRLLRYYADTEAYEKCNLLLGMKKKNKTC